jgi:ABC transport system ATP-binding/permease protein
VLVLDEPTNDLDIETLDLLEELLQNYEGTVFLVSHDRRFVDGVVTSTIVHEGEGRWKEYEGGVEDWLVQSQRAAAMARSAGKATATSGASAVAVAVPSPVAAPVATPTVSPPAAPAAPKRKLSYKEQRELDELPARLEALETEQKTLGEALAGTELYSQGAAKIAQAQARYAQIEEDLMGLLERWERLSAR